jgi:indolepyruvate ferredoxin oxidoreductase
MVAGPLKLLAGVKILCGMAFDVFGYARVRREERALVEWYRGLVRECLESDNVALARSIVELPDQIRGYENIKLESIRKIKTLAEEKMKELRSPEAALQHLTIREQ